MIFVAVILMSGNVLSGKSAALKPSHNVSELFQNRADPGGICPILVKLRQAMARL